MDSAVVQSQGHECNEQQPHTVGSQQVAHGAEEPPHDHEEKHSVIKKVKAKAKKIKDTIKKHGHHEHDHGHEYHYEDQHIPDDHDLDEEDDEDEEMAEDPEVHGAPIYESAAVKSATPGQIEKSGNFGGTSTVMGEEPHHDPRVVVVSPTDEINQNRATDPARTFVGEENAEQRKVNLKRPIGLEEDPHAPGSRPEAYAPANYQTKVTDPTGAGSAEIDITPVQKSFARMNVYDEPKPNPEPKVLPTVAETQYPSAGSRGQHLPELSSATKTQYPYVESHYQYLPELPSATKTPYRSAGSHDQYLPELSSATKTQYPSAGSHDQFVPEFSTATKTQYPSAGSHYQFVSEPIPTSSNRYPENPQATPFNTTTTVEEQPHYGSMEKPSNQSSYTDKISSATSAIADKAITAKNAVASKLGYGEKGNREENETRYEENRSGEKPPNQSSSYTEKLSSATSAIADKAVSAKNTVASKLGYGEKGDRDDKVTTHEEQKNRDDSTMSGSTAEYGKKIAHSLTEKLAPVYGKVGGVGSAVKSKVPGTGTGANSGTGMKTESVVKEQDKGVSVKDYLAHKLRPGDEDRALSEVISEALHKKREEPTEARGEEDRAVSKVVSDALHKREEEPERADNRPMGKVTESEEVKRRLGTGNDEKSEQGTSEEIYVNSPGKGVVDKLKDVVGSWLGRAGENQSTQGGEHLSSNSGAEGEQAHQAAGGTRLQESSG